MNLPNKLTVFRILCIPVFVIFLLADGITYNNYIAVAIFILASLTDFLDGKSQENIIWLLILENLWIH